MRRFWSSARGKGEGQEFIRNHARHVGDDCLIWPLSRDIHGYAIVTVMGKAKRASRLMCETAHGPAPTPKHRPGSTCRRGKHGCINPQHLRWMTTSEIMLAARGGLGPKVRKGPAILTLAAISEIGAARGSETQAALGLRFGVPSSYIGKIHRAEIYTSGTRALDIPRKQRVRVPRAPRIVRGVIRHEPLLTYPYLRMPRPEHDLLLRISSILPRGMRDDRRADLGQQIAVSIVEGLFSIEQIEAPGGLRPFMRQFYVANYEDAGHARAFDLHAFHLTSDMGLGAMQ